VVHPDTSIWIAELRAGGENITRELTATFERRAVLACGPVVAELVAGARPHD
jgi:hypothetical protein